MHPAAGTPQTFWTRRGKRVFDVIGGGVLVVLLSPLLLLCAALIKLTSRGPLLFIQVRAGREGAEFRPYKFRTMRGGRTPDPKELVPLHHPEITRVGRVLRRLKLDELPQLFNVLTGEMSLVGPRPTLRDQVAAYDAFQWQRMTVRPGLTGLAQVNSSAASPWDERIQYDVYYAHHAGLWLDLGVLLKTAPVMLLGEERFARPFEQSPYARR